MAQVLLASALSRGMEPIQIPVEGWTSTIDLLLVVGPQKAMAHQVEKMIGTTLSTRAAELLSLESWHSRNSSKPPHSMRALQKTMRPEVIAAIPLPTRLSMSPC